MCMEKEIRCISESTPHQHQKRNFEEETKFIQSIFRYHGSRSTNSKFPARFIFRHPRIRHNKARLAAIYLIANSWSYYFKF